MKKLLVTAIGAAAAFGAVADTISTQRFETAELGPTNIVSEGTYWSGDALTNTYTVVSAAGEDIHEGPFGVDAPTKALEVKTTFGSPLKLNAIAGGSSTNIPASGIYFDSLVKFTACEDEPEQSYPDAKIVMWLQEQTDGSDNITGTNIMVRASYANADGTFTPTNFVCKRFTGSIDSWYRVTIKTWASILNNKTVPGFAIFIDGVSVNVADEYTMADEVAANLTEAAGYFGNVVVFPSLVQGEATGVGSITSASFDGTGKLTDLVFTDEAPFDAAKDYVAPKAYVTVGELQRQFGTLAEAIAAVNEVGSGNVQFRLAKGMTLDGTLAFASTANVVLDFAGFVLTNNSAAVAISNAGRLTITNSTGNGGIYCSTTGPAISDTGAGAFAIAGGNFWGHVVLAEGEDGYEGRISGGAYMAPDDFEAFPACLPSGKKFASTTTPETGLYEVVNKVNYTVKFISGEGGSNTNEYTQLEGTTVAVPAAQEIVGKTFSAWSPAIDGATVTVTADATYTAVYTINEYSVKFVYGLNKEYTNTVIGVTYNTVPTLPAEVTAACEVTGYTVTWPTFAAVTADATYEASYSANTYTVMFYTNSVEYTTATYTYGNTGSYSAPADPSVSGYTFGGWYTDNGTFESAFTFDANVAGDTQVAYAKLTEDAPVGPTPIDPSAGDPSTVVDAESAEAAISAATIAAPTGVDAAAYKSNFDFSAADNGDGTFTVTLTGIKESVEQTAAASAEAILTGDGSTVTVPAGLYYKVTTYTALGSAAVSTQSNQSDGTGVSVTKPGDTQGFIKVEMSTVPFN